MLCGWPVAERDTSCIGKVAGLGGQRSIMPFKCDLPRAGCAEDASYLNAVRWKRWRPALEFFCHLRSLKGREFRIFLRLGAIPTPSFVLDDDGFLLGNEALCHANPVGKRKTHRQARRDAFYF